MTTVAGKADETRAPAGTELLFSKNEWVSQRPNQPISVSGTDGCKRGRVNQKAGIQSQDERLLVCIPSCCHRSHPLLS